MFKKPLLWLPLVVALVFVIGITWLIGSDSNAGALHSPRTVSNVAQQDNAGPISLNGTWTQTSGAANITMTATITSGKISVGMSGPVSGSYWQGSFDTLLTKSTSFTVTSTSDGDPQLAAAGDKLFTYNNGDLSFEFTMLGQTSTVHLQRSSE